MNAALAPCGLVIDEYLIMDIDEFAPFLDILFCFDKIGSLQRDLYVKPTNAISYLNYYSAHPKHVFSGVVYSQGLRLRRIIQDDSDFELELSYLKNDFLKSQYPPNMIDSIFFVKF